MRKQNLNLQDYVAQQKVTIRDMQAMRNFHDEGISFKVLAEHYGCSVDAVREAVEHKPWLQSKIAGTDFGNPATRWWESDHRDPLECVKLFYPQYLSYLSLDAPTAILSSEKKQDVPTIDPETYLEKKFGLDYVSDNNIKVVQRVIDNILAEYEKDNKPVDIDDVERILDEMVA